MSPIRRTRERLQHAAGLAAILDAAYDAFEDTLLAMRTQEDPASLFAAFMMAAASAADGRDAVWLAPSLPVSHRPGAPVVEDEARAGESAGSVADAVADLSRLLADRLVEAWESASDSGDRDACADAARCAENIYGFLRGSGP